MKKRTYGSKTMRQKRATHTDRLNACQTWHEVESLPFYDDWIKTVPINLDWIQTQPYLSQVEPDSRLRYEELCDQIDDCLNDRERSVFYSIAEERKSLRLLAKEMGCSNQTVQNIYKKAKNKLQKRLEDWRA